MQHMTNIKKISVLSLAKLHAMAIGFLGVIMGVLYAFGGLLIDTLVTLDVITSSETPGLSYGTLLAFGALVMMPIIFAICGFFMGAVVAVLFNTVTRWTNGIHLVIK